MISVRLAPSLKIVAATFVVGWCIVITNGCGHSADTSTSGGTQQASQNPAADPRLSAQQQAMIQQYQAQQMAKSGSHPAHQ